MSLRIFPAAERRTVTWKNGGGITKEIAADPPGASLSDFDWRVSQADVHRDGAFSRFPGIDRITIVLEGTLTLEIDGKSPVVLSPGSPPFHYPGGYGAIGEQPARDLNVMTRRGRFSAQARRIASATALPRPSRAETLLLFATRPLEIEYGGGVVHLLAGDAAIVDGPEEDVPLALSGADVDCYLIVLQKLA